MHIIFYQSLIIMVACQIVNAQENKQMLMYQIKGANYIKTSFDKDGVRSSYEEFKVGKVEEGKESYSVSIKIYMFNKIGVLSDSTVTKYACRPSDKEILMNILPFTEFGSNKEIRIKSNGRLMLYPSKWVVGDPQPDISLTMTVEGGVLGALGTTTKLDLSERRVISYNNLDKTYTLTSRVQIKSYMFGIKVVTNNYQVEEIINPQLGILRQELKKTNGDYSIITRKSE